MPQGIEALNHLPFTPTFLSVRLGHVRSFAHLTQIVVTIIHPKHRVRQLAVYIPSLGCIIWMGFEWSGEVYPWFGRMPVKLWRKLRQSVYHHDGGRCKYCAAPVELFGCHIHHVLPLSENGTNHPSNLKTLCVKCHKKRHPHMKTTRDKLYEQ